MELTAGGGPRQIFGKRAILEVKGKGREVIGADGSYELRESPAPYRRILGHENEGLRRENSYFWDDSS